MDQSIKLEITGTLDPDYMLFALCLERAVSASCSRRPMTEAIIAAFLVPVAFLGYAVACDKIDQWMGIE